MFNPDGGDNPIDPIEPVVPPNSPGSERTESDCQEALSWTEFKRLRQLANDIEDIGQEDLLEIPPNFVNIARLCKQCPIPGERKYVADVFVPRKSVKLLDIVGRLSNFCSSRRTGVCGFVAEADHVHIIHDCSYAGRRCRCKFRESLEGMGYFKQSRKYVADMSELTERDWVSIILYYFLGKVGAKHLRIDGETQRFGLDSEHLQGRKSLREWTSKLCAVQDIRVEHDDNESQHRTKRAASSAYDSDEEAFHGKKSKRQNKWDKLKAEVFRLLQKYHCSPLQTISQMEELRQQSLLTNPKHKEYIAAAINLYSMSFIGYTLSDFKHLLLNRTTTPVFTMGTLYGGIQQSVEIIDELLQFQFDNQKELIVDFLQTLADIFNKKIPKLNCLVVHSPPSAGKNFFFDMLFSIVINYGQLGK